MKTLKFLKISAALQTVFYLFCAVSNLCLYLWYIKLGMAFTSFWILNPIGPVCLIIGIILFLIERKKPQARALIGRKWLWIPGLFFMTLFVYVISGMIHVFLTGGV